ncbi:GntR family transcriptional regulator [Rhizobium paknamense]|uniref:GntR family transcriptional regulator of vanillate catabolism n=1 Tax=Rhizobium paknamense TaxID=1206817 RepID=A0ABU0IC52_9HYPH|nr:GntR family transcriptional regulator [Rhizobium paknamense]MDQ0455817.1 GntR family transcriptional regulator of vanillate catabolism [Rhizobium paknamense]
MAEQQASGRQQTAKALLGLRDLVLTGQLAAGERLSEVALASRLAVSRTPLRAALQTLEQEGLLTPLSSGGYEVRRFSRQDAIDAIELRGVLEGTAARLAAERGVAPARLRLLSELVERLDGVFGQVPGSVDFEAYAGLNAEFHRLLAGASGSDLIGRELARVTRLPFASPNAFVAGAEVEIPAFEATLFVAQAQHKAIVEAISRREGARVEALMREHARLARHNLDFVLERQPELKGKVLSLAMLAS